MRLFVASLQSGAPPVFDFGNALNFREPDQSTIIDFNQSYEQGVGNDLTAQVWLNVDVVATFTRFLANNANDYIQFQSATRIQLKSTVGGTKYNFDFASIPVGTWFHFVFSIIGNTARCYLDGTVSANTYDVSTDNFRYSGTQIPSGTTGIVGTADEYGIKMGYGATQADVDALYNSGLGANFEDVISNPELSMHLNSSGSSTVAVNDGSGVDGTLENFTFTTSPWVDHYTGVPSLVNANVTNHTYTYVGTATEEFLQLMLDNSDQTTTGRTIDINGQTISPASQVIITNLVDNYGYNIIT